MSSLNRRGFFVSSGGAALATLLASVNPARAWRRRCRPQPGGPALGSVEALEVRSARLDIVSRDLPCTFQIRDNGVTIHVVDSDNNPHDFNKGNAENGVTVKVPHALTATAYLFHLHYGHLGFYTPDANVQNLIGHLFLGWYEPSGVHKGPNFRWFPQHSLIPDRPWGSNCIFKCGDNWITIPPGSTGYCNGEAIPCPPYGGAEHSSGAVHGGCCGEP